MTVDLNTVTVIQLGQSRDDNALTLDLDVSDMVAAYPNAAITLIVSRPSDDLPYAGKTELEGNILHWTVTATDTAIAGHGEIQVSCVQDGITKMSKVVQTEVLRSIDVPGEAPDPLGNYIDDIQNALHAVGPATDRANAAAKRAEDAADRLDPMGAEFEQIAQQVRNDAVSAGQSAEVAKDSAASASKDAALAEIASTDAVTAEGLATKASQAAQRASKDAVQAAADTARDAAHVSDIATGIDTSIQDLEDNKANYKLKVIGQDEVTQMDAREVLTFQDQYEGRLIEFLTNGDYPSKAVAWGYLMTDKSGNTYLVTWNRDATITQWSKDAFEKHLFESKNLINEPIVDIDNLTVDVVGNPPVMYSVRGARNRPPKTSENGTVFVMPHAIDRQLFFYTDMENGKQWVKVVNGTDGQHSFGTWEPLAITKADLLEELARPEYRNLVVNASLSPLGGYSADYNSSEIRNHVNGGGTVELRYVSPELGEQVYAYQKFKDGLAWFRRDVVTDSLVKVIDISVDYQGTVAVKETPYTPDPTLTQPNQAADAKSVGDALAEERETSNQLYANALKRSVTGAIVAADDVSPVEHSVECRVESKNLIPYPYFDKTKTTNGITFTDNGDGSITVNGTLEPTVTAYFFFTQGVHFSDKVLNSSGNQNTDGKIVISADMSFEIDGVKVTFNSRNDYLYINCYSKERLTIQNLVVRPQIERGLTATPYTPYIPDLTQVRVSRYGGNILPESILVKSEWQELDASRENFGFEIPDIIHTDFWASGDSATNGYLYIQGKDVGDSAYSTAKGCVLVKSANHIKSSQVHYVPGRKYRFWVFANSTDFHFEDYFGLMITINKPSDYIPPKNSVAFTPSADGTVTGMTSLSPNMTILSDNPGALISATYNQDPIKVIGKLSDRIAALESASTQI